MEGMWNIRKGNMGGTGKEKNEEKSRFMRKKRNERKKSRKEGMR